ncbi:monocarboxylate transporter 12-like [Patiria miniata]|uniref:Major facilitator superfamily (MFS) profile domain-containing protein n=1 Tax=Patiria miniata TaxID=46514 RepID=A0A913ZX28_PATMI|nr:monocarboxylate transporter 12-like [Patiria miniata]
MAVTAGWKILVVLAVFAQLFVTTGPLYNYNVFFVRFQDEFQTDAVVTGWLGSLSSSLLCASSPLAAVIGSKIGNLRLSVLGVVLALSGFLSTSFITSLGHGYLTLGIMAGLGAGFAFCAAGSLLLDWYSDQPGNCRATGSALLGSSVGVMVFGPVLNTLNASCGWRNSFRILSGVMLLVGLASALTLWKSNKVRQRSQNEEGKAAREKTLSHSTKEMIDGSSSTKGKKDTITPDDDRATLTTVNSFNDAETIPEWREVTVILENETVIKKTVQNGEDRIREESNISEGEEDKISKHDERTTEEASSKHCEKIPKESDFRRVRYF